MSKVFRIILLFILYFIFLLDVYSFDNKDEIKLITRQQWGANENYRYLDSPEWKKIINDWKKKGKKELTKSQQIKAKLESDKVRKANNFLLTYYRDIIGIKKVVKYEQNHKLAWPLAYSKKKVAIVVHHTDSDVKQGDDNYEVVRKIYKFHAITRAWGDIGYNYLVGTNGEIFEGRAGGDYVVGAHDKWNNQSTIGIALIGNYSVQKAPKKQLESLEKLIRYLLKKYNIQLDKKQAFFSWCSGISQKCQNSPLIIRYSYPIIGHRDAGHTACPGDALYTQLQNLKKKLGIKQVNIKLKQKNNVNIAKIKKTILQMDENSVLKLLVKLEILLDNLGKYKNLKLKDTIVDLRNYIFSLEKKKNILTFDYNKSFVSFDDTNKIKVKLSYPFNNRISFKISKNSSFNFINKKNETILEINNGKIDGNITFNFTLKDNKLYLKNKEVVDFNKVGFFRIKNNLDYIEISSWNRKPSWDKSGQLNDNKFRGDIILYTKNNKLIVVNELYLTDYLKGLGEVSNSENSEKIKTIVILARTYARWYITKARKFAGEWFDASDNPNIFQKYLGFGLEKRSPRVNKLVEETKDFVITYNGDLIKPWYFSSSNGRTIPFIEYCKKAEGVPDCAYPEKFPFLVGVDDPGSKKGDKYGHGVGVSGAGVEYLSKKGWNFGMIIKYFLKGVQIEKKGSIKNS